MKKFIALIACLCVCLGITGCGLHCNLNTEIKANGSGNLTLQALADEEMYRMLLSVDAGNTDVSSIGPVAYNGSTWYGSTRYKEFSNLNQLEEVLTSGDKPMFSTLEISTTGLKGRLVDDFFGIYEDETTAAYLSMMDIKFNIAFTFPYEIEETNGVISEDKHTVTWNLVSTRGVELYVKTKEPISLITIFALIGLAGIGGGVIAYVIVQKKKRKTEDYN